MGLLLSILIFSAVNAAPSKAPPMAPLNQFDPSLFDTESSLPSRTKRVYALEKAGLLELASKMDELDQDLFYFRAKTKSKKELAELYPEISLEKLVKFQGFIKEEK